MRPRAARGALLAAALAAASCARCGQSARSAEELLPEAFTGAGVTAPLGQVSAAAAEVVKQLGSTPAGEAAAEVARALPRELGFDPLTREGLLAAGLDPARGAAAIAVKPEGKRTAWVAALPLTKPEAFLQVVDKLVLRRGAFPLRTEEARGGVKVTVYARAGEPQKIGFGVVRGYGLVARGEDPAAELAAAAARAPEQSLAASPLLARARQEQGAREAIVLFPDGNALSRLARTRPVQGDASLGLALRPLDAAGAALPEGAKAPEGTPRGLAVRASVRLSQEDAHHLEELFAPGRDLLALLPPAPLRAQSSARPERLPALVRASLLGPVLARLETALAQEKLDLGKDLLAHLGVGAALAVQLSTDADLGLATDPARLDLAAGLPAGLVDLVALGAVADAPKLVATLERLEPAWAGLGIKAARSTADLSALGPRGKGAREWELSDALGHQARLGVSAGPDAVAWVVVGKLKTAEALAALAKGGGGTAAAPGAQARVDLGLLAARVRALPDAAYGSGPQAMVARALVAQVIEPLAGVKAALDLRPNGTGVVIDAAVSVAGAR